ncbi:hypothetical protein V5799_033908 [Amblyomma americanum]|uniref:Uncharacterized protein n=1 Tax=Amblyomma americanum TaxID=6943 RepID=A0AAQ4DLZ3_AMBAM
MQSMWNTFLARNPLLRRKHESEVEAMRLLLSKGKSIKMRQRKSGKNARAGRRPSRRSQKNAECPTDRDEDAQGDLSHTPLPGFRRKKRTTIEDRYRPLDIQVTRATPAQPISHRKVLLSEQSSEKSSDGAEKDERDLPSAGQEMTANSDDSLSEKHQASDDVDDLEENNSSESGNYPPLLSRREAQYFETGNDEDYCENSDT